MIIFLLIFQRKFNLIEAGCGVGNTIFPLLKLEIENLFIAGFDISETAISIVRESNLTKKEKQ